MSDKIYFYDPGALAQAIREQAAARSALRVVTRDEITQAFRVMRRPARV